MDLNSRDKIRDSEKRSTVSYYNPNSPTLSPKPQLITWHSLTDKNQDSEITTSPNYSVKTSQKPFNYFPQKTSYNPLQNSKPYSDWEKNVLNKIKLNFKEKNVINTTKELDISHVKGEHVINDMMEPNYDFTDADHNSDDIKNPTADFIYNDYSVDEMKRPQYYDDYYGVEEMKRPDKNDIKWPTNLNGGDYVIDEMKRPPGDFIEGDYVIDEMKRPDEDFIEGENVIDEMKRPDMVATLPTTSFPPQYKPTYRPDVGLTTSRPLQISTGGTPITKPPQYKPTFQPAILVSIKPTVNPEMMVRNLVYNYEKYICF